MSSSHDPLGADEFLGTRDSVNVCVCGGGCLKTLGSNNYVSSHHSQSHTVGI